MRLRFRFAKLGKIRWTSHRDMARMWERAIRRVGLPVAYSQGFSPHPKLHFGLALSTGHESECEYIDIDLVDDDTSLALVEDADRLLAGLSEALPVGIDVADVRRIDSRTASLQQAVISCEWDIEIRGRDLSEVTDAIRNLLARTEVTVTRQRKGKDVTDDIRPYVLDIAVVGPSDDGVHVHAHLATQPRGLRVSELLAALSPGCGEGRVRRTNQWTMHDGQRVDPFAGATEVLSATRTKVCTS